MPNYQTIDGHARHVDTWEEEVQAQLPVRRRSAFVALPPPVLPPVQTAPLDTFNVPTPAQSITQLRTTYEDRSKGFVWVITPVAAVTGLLSCVAGVSLFSVPLLSWAILQTFLAFFCLTWIVGYALHLFVSPDGSLFLNTWFLWRTVGREQADRHARYWRSYEDARRDAGRH